MIVRGWAVGDLFDGRGKCVRDRLQRPLPATLTSPLWQRLSWSGRLKNPAQGPIVFWNAHDMSGLADYGSRKDRT